MGKSTSYFIQIHNCRNNGMKEWKSIDVSTIREPYYIEEDYTGYETYDKAKKVLEFLLNLQKSKFRIIRYEQEYKITEVVVND